MDYRGRHRQFRVELDQLTRALAGGIGGPYDVAVEIRDLAQTAVKTDPAGYPLWLIWSALTERRESLADRIPAVNQDMRRAAREWRGLCHALDSERSWLERWVYEECHLPREPRVHPAEIVIDTFQFWPRSCG